MRELDGEILVLVGVYLLVLQFGSFLATNNFLSNVLAYGASQIAHSWIQHNLSSIGYKGRFTLWAMEEGIFQWSEFMVQLLSFDFLKK